MRYFEDVSFGQVGAAFVGATAPAPTLTDKVVVAITCLTETTFATLTPENDEDCFGTATGALGDAFDQAVPAGVTIYGRFTDVTLTSGDVIVYYAH